MRFFRPLLLAAASALLPPLLPGQTTAPQNTEITSTGPAEMVSSGQETTITFRDHVVVTGTNMKLTCDFLQVVVLRTGDPAATLGRLEKFRSMLATGNVRLVQGDREATCGRAEVLPEEDKVILSENPVVVDHDQNTRGAGEKITMFRGQHKVLIEKPILTAPPIKDLGFDKEKKPDATPETPRSP